MEGNSPLKKWFSARPAVEEGPKTRPKRYENAACGSRTGGRKGAKGFFNTLTPSPKVGE
jgi:hypothetical protein